MKRKMLNPAKLTVTNPYRKGVFAGALAATVTVSTMAFTAAQAQAQTPARLPPPKVLQNPSAGGADAGSGAGAGPSAGAEGGKIDGDLKARITTMLSGYEYVPKAIEWKRMPQNATRETLIAMFDDAETPFFVRARLVSALSHFPGEKTTAFLTAVLAKDDADSLVLRRTAAKSLSVADPAAAVRELPKYLGDGELHLRDAVIQSLAKIDSIETLEAFKAAIATEKEPVLRSQLEAKVAQLQVNAKKLVRLTPAANVAAPTTTK